MPSPRDVPTYDHKPEMSAPRGGAGVRLAWREAAAEGRPFRFGIINFANADMVGPHRQHPGRDAGGRDRRPLPGRGGRRRCAPRAAR